MPQARTAGTGDSMRKAVEGFHLLLSKLRWAHTSAMSGTEVQAGSGAYSAAATDFDKLLNLFDKTLQPLSASHLKAS
eukprot:4313181-Heterocapsa_arctica.AAC.1